MIILDTNVISEVAKTDAHHQVQAWIDRQQRRSLYATAISLGEIMFGIERLPEGHRKSALRQGMQQILQRYLAGRILSFDERAARIYGRIVAYASVHGKTVHIADGQIAAIAQAHHFTVATRDTAPFVAAGVSVINPWVI
ncbi:type II toxin-antitoxin system VapC family toxin [Neorhizobium sp. JUb45]|uniref:type II toxin-antitoxin system VapC family toxin n=1 Tax=unclassified Neorhizobium TaxID=2629175 RepID=UPI0010457DFD|nr:type II toxin-antitoxin system VapC family toxin [Neorhizobium sp. JUb45]TCR04498.1 hypothetical protein EDF70_102597 [Neorhizobium sp. JUb45]